jgi:pimeloyl-ACP methyl ester carboxylesterase
VWVTQQGQGPAVLFLSGAGADHVGWGLTARHLRTRYRTIAFDARGTGRTQGPALPVSVEVMAEDALALVEALLPGERVHLVGHSMGTRVALALALRLPQKAASLTLFAPWDDEDPYVQRQVALRQAVLRYLPRELAAELLLSLLTSRAFQVESPERFQAYLQAMFLGPHAPSWEVIREHLGMGSRWRIPADAAQRLGCPVLVVAAEEDRMVEPRDSESLARRLGARYAVLRGPHASHLAHVEMAETFASLVGSFLDEVEAGRVSPVSGS